MLFEYFSSKIRKLSREAWVFVFLTALTAFVLFKFVDLKPQVDNDFFFSSDDPHFQADNEITKLFERKDSQLIISASGNIYSPEYQQKVKHFSGLLKTLGVVVNVLSVTDGPNGTLDAFKSPLWRRLLISDDQKSTNLIVLIDESKTQEATHRIESLIQALESKNFEIKMSGFPYIVELIRRYLMRDIQVFSSFAFILLGFLIIFVFNSWRILLGTLISCINAGALTFMISSFFGIKIGLLTANLGTIIFVLTLSHIIFLTFNWRNIQQEETDSKSATDEAIVRTFPASFWSMITTLLGFVSLLFVQPKPLRELGLSGVVGSLLAITAAYCIYPAFLRLVKARNRRPEKQLKEYYDNLFIFFKQHTDAVISIIACILVVSIPNLWTLNTDPSLISYFAKDSEITQGLKYIDRNGGSSPLVVVLEDQNGETLNSERIYRRLWKLQEHLENHDSIGGIISLPVLMAESKRNPFTFFFAWEWLLDIMESPQFDSIAKSFITSDRQHGLFLLRMIEEGRITSRLDIMDQITDMVSSHGFNAHLMGGVYALQGQLSKLVAESLIWGLGRLLILFAIIAYVVSRTFRMTFAMTFSIGLIPICIFGFIGLLRVPLDIIAAPAANVAIAIGIDAMIHMVKAYRRISKKVTDPEKIWAQVRIQLWEPVITSTIIVSTGFGIFFFSSFPPTQRFGGSIVFGAIIAAMTALFIFPVLAELGHKKLKNQNGK